MPFLSNLVVCDLARVSPRRFDGAYRHLLEHGFPSTPPFAQRWFGRRYFELARSAEWFANSLVANAALEGYGSTQIWRFSNRIEVEAYRAPLRRHALDESRHSTTFARILHLTFPGLEIGEAAAERIQAMQPKYTPKRNPGTELCPAAERLTADAALDELVGVHITEIRALILQYLLRPVLLTFAPEPARRLLARVSDVLIADEARHIAYTAAIFEDEIAAGRRDFLMEVFERRAREFNELTLVEVEREEIRV